MEFLGLFEETENRRSKLRGGVNNEFPYSLSSLSAFSPPRPSSVPHPPLNFLFSVQKFTPSPGDLILTWKKAKKEKKKKKKKAPAADATSASNNVDDPDLTFTEIWYRMQSDLLRNMR